MNRPRNWILLALALVGLALVTMTDLPSGIWEFLRAISLILKMIPHLK